MPKQAPEPETVSVLMAIRLSPALRKRLDKLSPRYVVFGKPSRSLVVREALEVGLGFLERRKPT